MKDQTIITTAIPRITDKFQALDDVGWYGSAYLLTTWYEERKTSQLHSDHDVDYRVVPFN